MMRSMYSAVSGLKVHQTKMDVIGNNIANVNTVGYKRQTVSFQEVFSQVIRGASAPQDGRGGTNPQQIGLGVNIGAINTIHTKGPAQRTDNPEDLMIDGEGFFAISADPNYENRYYTRAGNFTLDRDGNLVTADGYKVLGYTLDENGKATNTVTAIQINRSETVAPTATSEVEIRGNLDSRVEVDDPPHTTDTIIKDSLGNSYTVTFKFEKTGDTTWIMSVDRITDQATGNYKEIVAGDNILNGYNSIELEFDLDGKLIGIGEEDLTEEDVDFDINLTNLNSIEFDTDKNGDTITDPVSPAGNLEDINLFDSDDEESYNQLTQYANDMDAKPYAQDGNSSGKIEGYSIDASGVVVGVFTNGERKALAQLMLAKFDNPMGLQKMGGNMFVDTRNSGEPQFGLAGSSGYGPIAPGTLEMSNVDLSSEFTDMITTQRGFQANSRVITTSDEMLQELMTIKR